MGGGGGGGSSDQDISKVISLVSMEPRLLVTTYHLTAKTSKIPLRFITDTSQRTSSMDIT